MNLAIRGIDANLGEEHADSFHRELHPDLKVDYILANPPFNSSDWGGERLREDKRWVNGTPPAGNANFAWVQHFIYHLAPNGIAGFVLANGSMSSNTSSEGEIRKNIIEADLVDCMVAMPGQLFYSTQIPVCLWFIARNRHESGMGVTTVNRPTTRVAPTRNEPNVGAGLVPAHNLKFRDRRGEILFIDARKHGVMIDRVHRELTDADITRIANTYHAWRGDEGAGEYVDIPGFCKSTTLEEVCEHGNVLTPGRYVGAEAQVGDGEPFEEKIARLTERLANQMAEARRQDEAIAESLKIVGFGDSS